MRKMSKILRQSVRGFRVHFVALPWLLVLTLLGGCSTLRSDLGDAAGEIIKSDADRRSYRSLVLDNRMQVLLISDPETDQAAAAMDVAVGQFNDPPDRQGLAHFLEHMLFLGTDKYPDADAYGSYLSAHGGYSNAFTGLEDTNYFFSIHQDYLEGALDRFSQFFISPRFDPAFAEREVHAVNSEHQKNINSDHFRIYQVLRNTANSQHPFSKFGTGNLESLRGGEIGDGNLREQLIRFYESHYSANLMKLVIMGKEPIAELERMARTYFAAVQDRGLEREEFAKTPVLKPPISRSITIRPVKSIRQLRLMFPIPPQRQKYSAKSADLLAHLLGHEGRGSILALLRELGWATSLSAGTGPDSREFAFFTISVGLTPEGRRHTDDIILLVFRYLERIRQEESLERYFIESRKIAEVEFRFMEQESPADYVSRLAMHLQEVSARHILVSPWLYDAYRPEQVRDLLDRLTPENMQQVLIATDVPADLKDPWYGTEYGIEPIPEASLSRWKAATPHPELLLPPPNPFVVENVALHENRNSTPYPVLIKQSDRARVWFKQDDTFHVPKGNIRIKLSTPDAYSSAGNAAMTRLFTELLKEALNEYSYPALVAGLHYEIFNSVQGIEFSLSGYSENLDIIFRKVIDEILHFNVNEHRFGILKNQMRENRQNMKLQQAYRQVNYEMTSLLSIPFWHTDEYLAVIDDITAEKLSAFIPELLSRLSIDLLAHGNFQAEEVIKMANHLESRLKVSRPLIRPITQTMDVPNAEPHVFQFKVPDVNSAIEVYYQAGPSRIRQSVALDLIQQMLEKPFYHQLRTLEQLGYLVWSGYRESSKVDGFMFLIQSNVRGPVYLQERIEQFIGQFEQQLLQMPDEEFGQYKAALIAKRREAPKNLQEETHRYWEAISAGRYDFNRLELEIRELQQINLAEVREMYRSLFIHPETRKQLTMHAVGSLHKMESARGQVIKDKRVFKQEMRFHPNPDGYNK